MPSKLQCDFSVGVGELQEALHLWLEQLSGSGQAKLLPIARKKTPMVFRMNFTNFTYSNKLVKFHVGVVP